MSKNGRHVVPNPGGGWAVRRHGASKASRIFKIKQDAVSYARRAARREGSDLYVHRSDGTIGQKDTYGNVLRPARDQI
jgi:hypothetical protein